MCMMIIIHPKRRAQPLVHEHVLGYAQLPLYNSLTRGYSNNCVELLRFLACTLPKLQNGLQRDNGILYPADK